MTTTPELRLIFKALVINPVSPDRVEFYNPGYLVVSRGRVERLSREDPSAEFPPAEFVDLTDRVILPGFVDTHVHLPQFGIMGIGSGELLAWLNEYTYPEEARFANEEYAALISQLFFDALVSNGTTTACIYSSIHEAATHIAFATAAKMGVRAFMGKVMMDRNSPATLQETTDESIHASLRLFEKWDGAEDGRLRYVFTPRFAAACSFDLMKRVGQIARERGAWVQSHLSENREEVELVRSLFPDQPSYADVYRASGLLSPQTVMAHCIHLSDDEIRLLARTQTRVAFCPSSNRTLRSGVMPYARLRDAGLSIGLGTDIAGGPTLSMFRQLDEALNSANVNDTALTPAGALYLATLGGAKVLGIADRVGSLAVGKDADFLVVNHAALDPLQGRGPYTKPEHILSRLCMRGDSGCIEQVYIAGGRRQYQVR